MVSLPLDPYDKNMIQYSENFLNDAWVINGSGTKSATLFAAPDGKIKANLFLAMDPTSESFVQTSVNSAATTTYTYSIWLKGINNFDAILILGDSDNEQQESISILSSAWTRFEVSYTSTTGGSPLLARVENASLISEDCYAFGAQLELGATATTYEPTGINFNLLYSSWDDGTTFTALVTDQTSGEMEWEGNVLISNLARTTPQGQLQTFSCDLQGTAVVTPNTI